MDIATIYQKSTDTVRIVSNSSPWTKVFIVALVILVLLLCFSSNQSEGFVGTSMFDIRRGEDIYDALYVSLYDELVYCKEKDNFEIDTFVSATQPEKASSKILDVGCGTGRHVGALTQRGYSTIGLDKSEAMIIEARRRHPQCEFRHDDALSPMAFPRGSFTHITCFYFTIYHFKNKGDFFKNCYDWLTPGGALLVHLVNRAEFIPVITATNPFTIFAAHSFSGERMTKTKVHINGYDYQSKFDYDANEGDATLTEELIDTSSGAIRKNEHRLYMPRQKDILDMATSVGFKITSRADMSDCQYDTHYLYLLHK